MNLLAHLHLGRDLDPIAAAGNLTADYCPAEGSKEFLSGIEFHRSIDAFTDRHPLVAQARVLFSGKIRRFAGILCDLAFDLCLSRTWSQWEERPRADFIDEQLATILTDSSVFPSFPANVVRRMFDERWLHSYARIEGIGSAIQRMSRRRPVAANMIGAEKEIARLYPELERLFLRFYPQLQSNI